MPSRADNPLVSTRGQTRARIELGLRVVAFTGLVLALLNVSGAFRSNVSAVGAPVVFRADSAAGLRTSSLLSVVKSSLLDGGVNAGSLRPVHLVASRVPSDTSRA